MGTLIGLAEQDPCTVEKAFNNMMLAKGSGAETGEGGSVDKESIRGRRVECNCLCYGLLEEREKDRDPFQCV
ncbi:hypothetical protein E1B28_012987 [Marasmius oreades]|uniref:Uncharacterized protein n=1 Tax=Marasmius oreades TaxID=181124 RepID=A0A9P7RPK2_9AGAR|nr:uncharacterized protein E1B28_012987 [Marasmius oreades]KAG7087008.1 hypothetical protein E1B28_012987 [Marasmius oreades]